ncbi:MAG: xylulokinase [Deltaproteobacteria bacterium]|nr:xylulokinase [Deltaproteobacteria bacterium]
MVLVAGVDSSTQSTTVEVRDASSGSLVASGSAPHPAVTPPTAEQDPAAWERAFEAAFAAAGAPRIEAISIAGQQHGLVALDADGEVVRPAKLWCDTTSAPDAAWLLARGPGSAAGWAEACGLVPVASHTITKLSWLHREEPGSWARLARVCLPHDWLTWRLCGEFVTDRGDASGTGYWSAAEEAYRFDLLEIVDGERDWSAALPRVCGPAERVGRWERGGPAVGPGTGDNMGAALGLGLARGEVAVSIGTSGTVYTVAESASADPRGEVAGFADATGRYLPLVCTLNAAKVTDAAARLLGVGHEELDALALAAPSGARGLTLVPYFDGERTPDRPSARGLVAGLRSDVSREEFARAAFEGVVCGLLDGLDSLARHAPAAGAITLVGGGAASRAYPRILADLSGRPVRVVEEPGSMVALGACIQAAAVLDNASPESVRAAWPMGAASMVEPDPAVDAAAVREAYALRREESVANPDGAANR